jgi:hypothetical protein
MRSMNCKNIRREIEEAESADLFSPAVISHIEACAACKTLSRQQTELQVILASLGTVEAPGDFDFRLRARLAGEKRRNGHTFSLLDFSFGPRSMAVAAMLLLIGSALVVVSFRSRPQNPVIAGGKQTVPATPDAATTAKAPVDPNTPRPILETGGPKLKESAILRPIKIPKGRGYRSELATFRGGNRVETRDLSSTPARVVKPDDQLTESYPTAAFPINASYQSLKVSVDDGNGTSRTISLPAVSFGSQRTLSESAAPLLASARGTW